MSERPVVAWQQAVGNIAASVAFAATTAIPLIDEGPA